MKSFWFKQLHFLDSWHKNLLYLFFFFFPLLIQLVISRAKTAVFTFFLALFFVVFSDSLYVSFHPEYLN